MEKLNISHKQLHGGYCVANIMKALAQLQVHEVLSSFGHEK
jgi:hypothetical protein